MVCWGKVGAWVCVYVCAIQIDFVMAQIGTDRLFLKDPSYFDTPPLPLSLSPYLTNTTATRRSPYIGFATRCWMVMLEEW